MVETKVVRATLDHAIDLAPRMRLADRREIWASGKSGPHRALIRSMRRTRLSWCGMADGVPVCLFGVMPAACLGSVGVPWLLGSDDLPRHATAFLRGSREYVNAIRSDFDLLTNFVDSRNALSIRWLRWLGFDILPAEPYGAFRLPFHRFEMRSGHV